jgi:hypothetical protein
MSEIKFEPTYEHYEKETAHSQKRPKVPNPLKALNRYKAKRQAKEAAKASSKQAKKRGR